MSPREQVLSPQTSYVFSDDFPNFQIFTNKEVSPMPHIRQLEAHVADLIAAGEVV